MKILRFFARLIFGLVFVTSGWLKIMDPIGTGLQITEYLQAAHLGFLSFASVPAGIVLSALELLVGISVLLGFQMRLVTTLGLGMTAFFTLLTAWIYAFDPVQDCGCFGEAISLTNAQTFWKNVLLLACILPVFWHRRHYRLVAPRGAEWSFLGLYLLGAVGSGVFSLIWQPWVDFGDFREGNSIKARLEEARTQEPVYLTTFLYEKDGVQQEFSLENLPDSTWHYLSTQTQLQGDPKMPFDFALKDVYGQYVTDSVLSRSDRMFTAVLYRPDTRSDRYWRKLSQLQDSLQVYGTDLYVLLAATPDLADSLSLQYGFPMDHILFSDYKTLIALSRSNGGVVYWDEAIVVKKWSFRRLPTERLSVLREDAEIVAAGAKITQQLVCEGIILISLLLVALLRYVSGIVYNNRRRYNYLRRLAIRKQKP